MYLLDSNIYINFYDRYYCMNFFPTFWQHLVGILDSNVVIPDIVVLENYQDPSFLAWLNANYNKEFLNHKNFVSEWIEVINHLGNCGYYKPSALSSDKGWANERIADPWLIAIAKKKDYTIVTDEIKNPNLNKINPSKSAKIPDVCEQMGVKCISMNQFFKEVKLFI